MEGGSSMDSGGWPSLYESELPSCLRSKRMSILSSQRETVNSGVSNLL